MEAIKLTMAQLHLSFTIDGLLMQSLLFFFLSLLVLSSELESAALQKADYGPDREDVSTKFVTAETLEFVLTSEYYC